MMSTEKPSKNTPEHPGSKGLSGEVTFGERTKDGKELILKRVTQIEQSDGSRTLVFEDQEGGPCRRRL